jgi:hypothetical protein
MLGVLDTTPTGAATAGTRGAPRGAGGSRERDAPPEGWRSSFRRAKVGQPFAPEGAPQAAGVRLSRAASARVWVRDIVRLASVGVNPIL